MKVKGQVRLEEEKKPKNWAHHRTEHNTSITSVAPIIKSKHSFRQSTRLQPSKHCPRRKKRTRCGPNTRSSKSQNCQFQADKGLPFIWTGSRLRARYNYRALFTSSILRRVPTRLDEDEHINAKHIYRIKYKMPHTVLPDGDVFINGLFMTSEEQDGGWRRLRWRRGRSILGHMGKHVGGSR